MATRLERVILELDDQFTTPMAQATARTALLSKELDSLGKRSVESARSQEKVAKSVEKAGAAASGASPKVRRAAADVDVLGRSSRDTDSSINQLTGRLRVMAEVAAILGPTLSPIGAVAGAGIAGLATQLSVAAIAGGTLIGIWQGVGDTLEAVNEAALEPTAENIAAANEALNKLAPSAREAVMALQAARPVLTDLRNAGAQQYFPGFVSGLDALMTRGPDVTRMVEAMSAKMGDLSERAGMSLAGVEWDGFFDWASTDAVSNLDDLGTSVGNVALGFGNLLQAVDPLSDDFSSWMVGATADFAAWADGLGATQGFQEFVEYVRETGPQVGDTLGAIADAGLQIAEAAAPLGGPVLAALEGVFKVVGSIADSGMGTPIMAGVVALSLLNRTMAVTAAVSARMGAGGGPMAMMLGGGSAARVGELASGFKAATPSIAQFGTVAYRAGQSVEHATKKTLEARSAVRDFGRKIGPGVGLMGGLAVASSGAADSLGLTHTASLALMGTMGGPFGAALGAGAGLVMDFTSANDELFDSLNRISDAISAAATDPNADLAALDQQLSQTRTHVMELADALNRPNSLGDHMKGAKNAVEGLFGRDDYEEAHDQYEAARADLMDLQATSTAVAQDDAVTRRESIRAAAAHSGAIRDNSMAYLTAMSSVGQFKDSLINLNGILSNRSDLRAYEAALDSLQAKAGATDWSAGTQAGRDNLEAFDKVAATAIERATKLKEQGKDLASTRVLQRAQKDLDDFVAKTPGAEKGTKRVRLQLEALVGTYKAEIKAMGIEPATASARELKAALDALKGKTIQVTTVYHTQGSAKRKDMGFADGIPKAAGGPIVGPGTGTSDEVPIWASNGEFMMKTAAVEKYGVGFMNALNSMALPATARFASGGQVGGKSSTVVVASDGKAAVAKTKEDRAREAAEKKREAEDRKRRLKAWQAEWDRVLRGLNKQVEKSTKSLQAEAEKRDAIVNLYDGLASAMSGKYKPTMFGEEKSPFLSGSKGFAGTLTSNNAEMEALLNALPSFAGTLTGGALDALLEQGTTQEIVAMAQDPALMQQYASLYGRSEELNSALGTGSAEAAYGKERSKALESTSRIEATIKRIESELKYANKQRGEQPAKFGSELNGAANRGKKNAKQQ